LREYGEERYAKRIARAIIGRHQSEPITSTTELAQIVAAAHPRHQRDKHPATRTFQALRIAVNDELGELQALLAEVISLLAPGGRLVVLSFHSLEDRIVKNFIQQHSRTRADLPLDLPVVDTPTPAPLMRVRIDKKPGRAEIQANRRSRSVIMRVAQRTSAVYPTSAVEMGQQGNSSKSGQPNADSAPQALTLNREAATFALAAGAPWVGVAA
jgi:16S rRNA (cytosine1402-N4)-methyltransferase